jgi:diadenosine tetraphosphatase ApaH/serine/threonine PP2A family protein phosphatase
VYPNTSDDQVRDALRGIAEPIVIAGHTHIPMERRVDGWRIINPGSVGVPLDGNVDAQFLMLESAGSSWRATHRRIAYDRKPLFDEFDRQSFREQCGIVGELVLDEFRTARVHVHAFYAWRQARAPDRPIDDNILSEFRQADWKPFVHLPHRW